MREMHFDGGTADTEEQRTDVPSTVERRIVRPVRGRRKLRKMDDGGKLEVVHNSSDFNSLMLRPRGQKENKNKKSRRLDIEEILECEGGRFDP